MPFQSEKQRRYMHANLPKIANRWEQKYGLGGIAEQNAELNQLPEYYLPVAQGGRIGYEDGTMSPALKQRMLELLLQGVPPHKLKEEAENQLRQDPFIKERMGIPGYPAIKEAAHGGFIPAHQAGVLGLAEGGRTGFYKGSDRHAGTGDSQSQAPSSGPHGGDGGGDGGYQNVHQTGAVTIGGYNAPKTTPPDDGRSQALINISKQKKRPTYRGDEDLEGQLLRDQQLALNRLKYGRNLTKYERQSLEVGLGLRQPKQSRSIWKTIGTGAAIITGVAPLLGFEAPAAVQTVAQLNSLHNKAENALATFNMINKTDHTLESLFNEVKNIETADKKLIASLPDNSPEKIELLAKMKIKTPGDDGKDGASIKIEDIETVNKTKTEKAKDEEYLKMQRAAYLQYLEQQKKRQAYLDNYNQMFLANKGGLAGLFRVKNT